MKVELKRDFNNLYKFYRINTYKDMTGLYFLVIFTGREKLGKHYFLKRSQHNSFMLTYVKKGKGILKYNDKKYELKENSLIMIDCMPYHELYPLDENMEINYVHIYNSSLPEFFRYLNKMVGPVMQIDDKVILFDNTITKIQNDFENKQYDNDKASIEIYKLLMRIKNYVSSNSKINMDYPEIINKAILYINQNINSKILLDDIAKTVGLSKFHLEVIFKKSTGKSIGEFIKDERIKRSQELLLNSDLSILEISNEVGFSDSQGLIRLYKDEFDLTPLEFRKTRKLL